MQFLKTINGTNSFSIKLNTKALSFDLELFFYVSGFKFEVLSFIQSEKSLRTQK